MNFLFRFSLQCVAFSFFAKRFSFWIGTDWLDFFVEFCICWSMMVLGKLIEVAFCRLMSFVFFFFSFCSDSKKKKEKKFVNFICVFVICLIVTFWPFIIAFGKHVNWFGFVFFQFILFLFFFILFLSLSLVTLLLLCMTKVFFYS